MIHLTSPVGRARNGHLMLHTKACPRCSGDLALVEDIADTYLSCVQCGYMTYQLEGSTAPATPALTPSS